MTRNLALTVHGPDPLTVTATLKPDFGPEIPGAIDPVGTAHFAFVVPDVITGGASRTIEAPGWDTNTARVGVEADGTETGMPLTDTELPPAFMEAEVPEPPDPIVELVRLEPWGQHFRKENGERFTAVESTDFNLMGRWFSGEDIDLVLEQRAAVGYNMLRVFTAYNIPNTIGVLKPKDHPNFYARIPEFLAKCATYGLYVELVAFTGPYVTLFANDSEKVLHWEGIKAAAKVFDGYI